METPGDALTMRLSHEELATRAIGLAAGLFAGKTVLVTGGSGSIGEACAWIVGRLGAKVILNGRNAEKLTRAAQQLDAGGIDVTSCQANLREPEEVDRLFACVAQESGIDAVINAAGGQFPQAAIDFSRKGWKAVIDTNLNGTWWVMQEAARAWAKDKRPGAIVNIVVVINRGLPGIAHSVAARAGIVYLSKNLAVEWAPLKINVNCVAPGVIRSEGLAGYSPEARQGFAKANPQGEVGDPWDIGTAAAYLVSEPAKFITGETLTIDGGGSLWGEFDPLA